MASLFSLHLGRNAEQKEIELVRHSLAANYYNVYAGGWDGGGTMDTEVYKRSRGRGREGTDRGEGEGERTESQMHMCMKVPIYTHMSCMAT